ncbi:hypothetical protein Btru_075785 [Bulinus truncatus]|nr:hypothetical protein Btru_075785 [Bulinus truncatus]
MEENNVSQRFKEGDVLEFCGYGGKFWGICVGNDMFAHSKQDPFRLKTAKVQLDKIDDFCVKMNVVAVKWKMPLIKLLYMGQECPEEIVTKALLSADNDTLFDSKEFIDYCCYGYRKNLYLIVFFVVLYACLVSQTSLPDSIGRFLDDQYQVIIGINCGLFTFGGIVACFLYNRYNYKSNRECINEMEPNKPYAAQIVKTGQSENILKHSTNIIDMNTKSLGISLSYPRERIHRKSSAHQGTVEVKRNATSDAHRKRLRSKDCVDSLKNLNEKKTTQKIAFTYKEATKQQEKNEKQSRTFQTPKRLESFEKPCVDANCKHQLKDFDDFLILTSDSKSQCLLRKRAFDGGDLYFDLDQDKMPLYQRKYLILDPENTKSIGGIKGRHETQVSESEMTGSLQRILWINENISTSIFDMKDKKIKNGKWNGDLIC